MGGLKFLGFELRRKWGRGEHTRVVCKTFDRRGKSLTPESRIEMLEDRSWLLERREETQEERGFVILGTFGEMEEWYLFDWWLWWGQY